MTEPKAPTTAPASRTPASPRSSLTLVVVGRANTGKSTLVATLTEDPSIHISDVPGTTTEARRFDVNVGTTTVFSVVDTPGFEDPVGAFGDIEALTTSAADRVSSLRRFVQQADAAGTYQAERRLLRPVLEGGAILYVADASFPWRQNHQEELEILRWTGQPRAALINRTAEGDYSEEWARALDQYFPIVRTMSARDATWLERLSLLEDIGSLRSEWKEPIQGVVDVLRRQWDQRRRQAARAVARMIVAALKHTRKEQVERASDLVVDIERLEQRFADDLRAIEEKGRYLVEAIYLHQDLRKDVNDALDVPRFESDLFARETWNALGLSTNQLLLAGAAGGAATGLLVDAAVGGLSGGGGALIGGLVGLAGAAFTDRNRLMKATVERAGFPTLPSLERKANATKTIVVGPHKGPNFPWVLLVRAVSHWYAVEQRTHAQEGALRVRLAELSASELPESTRKAFTSLFRDAQKALGSTDDALVFELEDQVLRMYTDAEMQRRLQRASEGDPRR